MPARAAGGFADIHSHVLYGMDDGAKTREESLRMLELAARSGTTDIVATPHANSLYRYEPGMVDAQVADMNESVQGIRVHRGCDFHLQMDNIQDAVANPRKYTISGYDYLMVEFPDVPMFHDVDAVLGHLRDAGLIPIITHPERHSFLHSRLNDLTRWVDHGCYLQVTAGSITGNFGRRAQRFSQELLSRGLVHAVASDAHDTRHRPPTLRPAYEALVEHWGADPIHALFVDNPRAVIRGEAIDIGSVPLPRKRKWFQLWK